MAGLVRGIFGVRDYRYASLEDIVAVLRDFEVRSEGAVQELKSELKYVGQRQKSFVNPSSIVRFIHHWTYILESFERDFRFVADNISRGIQQSHLDMISKIYTMSHEESDSDCAKYDVSHLQVLQPDREADLAVERIYDIAQGQFIDYFDLSGMLARLRELSNQVSSLPDATKNPTGEIQKYEAEGPSQKIRLEVPKGSNWGDIVLQFVGLESLYIRAGSSILGTFSFVELGFEDRRRVDAEGKRYPNKLWKLLMLLSETKGSFSWKLPGADKTYKKTLSLLRTDLRRLFPGIKDKDPFHRYDERNGYRAKFAIRPLTAPSE